MCPVALTFCSIVNFILAIASIAIQAVVIGDYEDCAYSKMGVGIWNGILLLVTGCLLLVIVCKKEYTKYVVVRDLGMVMSALTLMASLVQAGVACGVIYRLNELQYYNNYSNGFQKTIKQTVKDQIPSRFDLKSIVRALDDIPNAVYEWGTDQVSNAIGKTWENIEERLCFNLYRSEFYGTTRKGLEYGLLAVAIIAVISHIICLVLLRSKPSVQSPSIHYQKEVSPT